MVVDMPYKTYQNKRDALKNSIKVIKETKCDAVKLEGGKKISPIVRYLTRKNIPVMGHVGLLPQSTKSYKLKGKNKSQEVLRFAVKRMLPGGSLAKKQLSKLKMYYGDKHPHTSQNPIEINFSKLNRKNKA